MLFGSYSKKELKRVDPIAKKVFALEDTYRAYSDAQLRETTQKLKDRLAAGETLDDILPDAFACCREAADRVLGMRHFPVQVIGGIVLHQGRIAEMKTGEGKTLVATLPAYLNALAGKGVHIVTVNDYLAKRDSEWMGKVYRFLGLSVGLIVNGMDNAQRREAYGCDITYGTNNELGFDYLRDNMVIYKENKVQRGHNFAIVDEVDSILIDEARTPLIISGQGDKSTEMYKIADQFAKSLRMTKVAELNDKEDNDEIEGDYIVDEKAKTATLTKEGIKKAEKYFNIENLNDAENMEIAHHINQAIRARGIMVRDVDYVVKDGEVIIVDEFTGRLMIGRRFNEGLHQAIEAKEGVKVLRESKTLATITFQNYFRMYQKLSGMTGTALTEQVEFTEIYKLDVIEIPTNRPNVRQDHNDRIYKTEAAKFRAVIEQIVESHKKGQPVLVGTISIEKSEHLSSLLKKQGIKHEVLNAKYHEKEAEIVAQAGQKGAVTIATNMAGRGTDIVLGGNAEFMAKTEMRRQGYAEELIAESTGHSETEDEEILAARKTFAELEAKYREQIRQDAEAVKEAGGLFIIGTERHESRRIDNQLRGRAGRQGDPGETIFFLSLEDDLMRLFGGERVQNMMGSLGLEEDQPIEMKVLTNAIESAQRKVEGRNFGIRKNVLRYDDVMNKQREIIYAQRDKVLNGEDVHQNIVTMLEDTVQSAVSSYIAADSDPSEWNIKGLKSHYLGWILDEDDLHYTEKELADLTPDKLRETIIEKAKALYAAKEELYGAKIMRELERVVLLRVVDTKWMDHIDAMEELKQGIYLRSYAQKDPAVEYQIEGFDMFDELIESIKEDTVKMVLTMVIKTQEEPKREQVAKPAAASAGSGDGTAKKEPVRKKKIGRNDPCPCGSGKKYKKCCGRDL
ncbi:preprotein translocase subunit SecA [Neobittarella massiliensis]|uniref:Protein translocase subunit SecA n=2 Tax=Neobittarella massiliensis (ex Bilen et al. 2018) TaxID=2041842 RepID=A0A8J6ICM6_9FIRM|nr:preprotein translocase subunit SecA [Neobittarella massiliensis]